MKTETIVRIKLTAGEGMILTDGEVYGTTIFLAEGMSADAFREIPRAEYEAMLEAQKPENIR